MMADSIGRQVRELGIIRHSLVPCVLGKEYIIGDFSFPLSEVTNSRRGNYDR